MDGKGTYNILIFVRVMRHLGCGDGPTHLFPIRGESWNFFSLVPPSAVHSATHPDIPVVLSRQRA